LISNQQSVTIVFPGDYSEGETPDPIPNSAVKPFSADDTTIGGKVGHRQGFFLFLRSAKIKTPRSIFRRKSVVGLVDTIVSFPTDLFYSYKSCVLKAG
jgi:hypothetical protein